MRYERAGLVRGGETICRITNPFKTDVTNVTAPFTGVLVGILEKPVVYPGNPLCHLVNVEDTVQQIPESRRRD